MNPNMYNNQYMQQMAQQVQQMPVPMPRIEERIISYPNIESLEQLSGLPPIPNTIYLGVNLKDGKIFMRRMNNDGLVEVKTFSVTTEQTKKTDVQEILDRLSKIESKQPDIQGIMDHISKLEKKIGGRRESTNDFNFTE